MCEWIPCTAASTFSLAASAAFALKDSPNPRSVSSAGGSLSAPARLRTLFRSRLDQPVDDRITTLKGSISVRVPAMSERFGKADQMIRQRPLESYGASVPLGPHPPAVARLTGAPFGCSVLDPTGTAGAALVGLPSQPGSVGVIALDDFPACPGAGLVPGGGPVSTESGTSGDTPVGHEGSSVSGSNGYTRATPGDLGCFDGTASGLRANSPKANADDPPLASAPATEPAVHRVLSVSSRDLRANVDDNVVVVIKPWSKFEFQIRQKAWSRCL